MYDYGLFFQCCHAVSSWLFCSSCKNANLYNNTVFNSLHLHLTFPCMIFNRPVSNWLMIVFKILTLNFVSALRFFLRKTTAREKYKVTNSFSAQCCLSLHLNFFIFGEISLLHNRQINLKQEEFVTSAHSDRKTKYLLFSSICRGKVFVISKTCVISLYKHNSFQRRVL